MRYCVILFFVLVACREKINPLPDHTYKTDSTSAFELADTASQIVQNDSILSEKIVAFAKTLKGVSYKYCSMDPNSGFDCSGFVNYVFNHFNIQVPRSSVEFTNVGEEIELSKARPADLILFTGTNPHIRVVGHIGIVTANDNGDISFIQSTSGGAYSVVVSPLDKSYMSRFVKVVRILKW